jgi:flagellar biosynthesis protein FlhF
MQSLVEAAKSKPFQPAALTPSPAAPPEPEPKKTGRLSRPAPAAAVPAEPYPLLLRSLLDAEIAPPLARQWVADLPHGLSEADARMEMRTRIAQRLQIYARPNLLARSHARILAFIGTTGVGKTTTIAKLAARFSLMEKRRVGIITLDTFRVAAAQQLKTYGDVLRLPVQVAHNAAELKRQIYEFQSSGIEIILLDTTGRSPNEMLPLGEAATVFESLEGVEKYLLAPATLSARDIDHVVARFRHVFSPDALILSKLDEAIDSACFGKLLTVQAKYGLPLAYVTTGQRVPDDLAVPDAHAIAARIVSNALF